MFMIDEDKFQPPPKLLAPLMADTRKLGFMNWSWPQVGALLRLMASMKPGGRLLEIGTGTGVGTCWLLDGMNTAAQLTTVDTNPTVQAVARAHLGGDRRLTILCEDGTEVIRRETPGSLDLIFSDGGAGNVYRVARGVIQRVTRLNSGVSLIGMTGSTRSR